jgi:hypothetical protein
MPTIALPNPFSEVPHYDQGVVVVATRAFAKSTHLGHRHRPPASPVRSLLRIYPVHNHASSLTVSLLEQSILNLHEFHGCRTGFVIIGDVVDPRAHGIAPHQSGVVGLQEVGHRSHILHSGVEP